MKRDLLVGTTIVAIVAALLSGCAPASTTPSGTSAAPSPTPSGPPSNGAVSLEGFVPRGAEAFSDGLVGLGESGADASGTGIPALALPLGGAKWRVAKLGSTPRLVTGAAEMGNTRVVVGMTAPGAPGVAQVPFCATSVSGGAYVVNDLGQLFGGRSAQIKGVVLSGDLVDTKSVLVAAGIVQRSGASPLGTPSGTDSFAIASKDQGKTWSSPTVLPLPKGVVGAEAMSLAHAPQTTAYPGVLVVGRGWTTDTAADPRGRQIMILWGTLDGGKTWKLISDTSFSLRGTNLTPRFIAADKSTIVVLGTASTPAPRPDVPAEQTTESWVGDESGAWTLVGDTVGLRPDQSSIPTALLARDGGGFLSAREVYTTADGPYVAGAAIKDDPSAYLAFSPDGVNGQAVGGAPSPASTAALSGIAEFGSHIALFGVDRSTHSKVWVIDGTAVQ
jgi:hypothetical protein